MDCRQNLLDAFQACGEAAVLYRGQNILMANENFASLFGRTVDECAGLPILEICHNESIEMIQDYIRRRALGNHDLPSSYEATFRTPSEPKTIMHLTVVKLRNVEGALVLFNKKE
ncbi:MAG TPA: PAS domain-containing protein [Patescibacteria group bacterium]|nr:PAS domain-containing protein [Patescibacteria group bacterium]